MQKKEILMQKQVDKSHYSFQEYMGMNRWASVWHQINEVMKLSPKNVLEIGPGPGIFKAAGLVFDLMVETLDIDPDLKPDYIASVFEMPFNDGAYDVVCAFQMLEHLPFDESMRAFKEMTRVANSYVVISLPNAARGWPVSITLPKLGQLKFIIPRLRFKLPIHEFDGEHFWEINKAGFSLNKVLKEFEVITSLNLVKTFKVHENPYHQFFVYKKIIDS